MKISTIRKALVLLALIIAVAVPVCAFAGGTGTSTDPYQVKTLDDLKAVTGSYYYKQMNNIVINDASLFDFGELTCSGESWTPIEGFTGNYKGGGYYITGLYVTDDNANGGLFGTLTDATIENLKIDFALVEADEYAGIVAAKADGTSSFNNVIVSGYVVGKTTKAMNTAGGFVGMLDKDASITSCASYAKVTGATSYSANIGGIAGVNYGTISTSGFGGNVYGTATYYDAAIGGIAGYNVGTIENCRTGNMAKVGGESTAKVNDCYVGGIAGVNKGKLEYCENSAEVSNKNFSSGDSICAAGGVAGMSVNTDVTYVTNNGSVTGEYVYAGGVAGVAISDDDVYKVQYCDNTGAVTSNYGVAGGIVGRAVAAGEGYVSIKLNISDCYNEGVVNSSSNGEMAGETAVVESATVNIGAEAASANGNACSAKALSKITAEAEQYGSAPVSTVTSGAGTTAINTKIESSDKWVIRYNGGRNTFAPASVLVTLTTVTDASKVEILSVDISKLSHTDTKLSGNVVIRVYKPDTATAADAVVGVSIGNKYVATQFEVVDAAKRVAEVTVGFDATVDVTSGTITVNTLVVDDTDTMKPLCENKKVSN